MAEVNINEIQADGDVDFDQKIDSDTLIAAGGGVVANGDISGSAINTGRNDGIMAGDDVDLEGSVVGDGNTQISDSTVGAFAARGNATNITGENINMGSGDLVDLDTGGGDAQLVNGNGNQTFGDIDVDAAGASGPQNFVFGNNNDANALQDNSTNIDDSFNTDNSIEDSFNTAIDDSFNTVTEDNDTTELNVDDSFNTVTEDNDLTSFDISSSFEDNSIFEDNDSFEASLDIETTEVDLDHSDNNDLDLDS